MAPATARWLAALFLVLSASYFWEPLAAAQNMAPPIRAITQQGYRVQLDLSRQVLRLKVPEDKGFRLEMEGGNTAEANIHASLKGLSGRGLTSASMLAQKAKQFDDGLYAAVELAAQNGAGRFRGKAQLLRDLAQRICKGSAPLPQPAAVVVAGARLGLSEPDLPPNSPSVQTLLDDFTRDELRSKPIGFYTWNEQLSAIFRQDRMLQTELKGRDGVQSLLRTLAADADARATYEAYMTLVSRLTNPPAYPDLTAQLKALDSSRGGDSAESSRGIPEKNIYFFPPSRAHETELVKRLYGDRPIPDGFSLIDELIKRIRARAVALEPTAVSGWYDYQTWAAEPLVIPERMPEAKHLDYDASYVKQLEELFKGIVALTRETHIKQLEIPSVGAAAPFRDPVVKISVYPELDAEPLASYYYRRALSYAFVRQVLTDCFGGDALKKMHRLTAAGPVEPSLADELRTMEGLFHGAHALVCRQIGMPPIAAPKLTLAPDAAQAIFAQWRAQIGLDADLGQDARMMVPVFYDIQRKKTKVWVMLGWTQKPLSIEFAQRPGVTVFDAQGQTVTDGRVQVNFHAAPWNALYYPVMAEVYVTQILDRDEFRRHCDQHRTRSAILANLK